MFCSGVLAKMRKGIVFILRIQWKAETESFIIKGKLKTEGGLKKILSISILGR
jgi:hypothetical protein